MEFNFRKWIQNSDYFFFFAGFLAAGLAFALAAGFAGFFAALAFTAGFAAGFAAFLARAAFTGFAGAAFSAFTAGAFSLTLIASSAALLAAFSAFC